MDSEVLFINRINELARRSEERYYTQYTDFLNPDEISTLKKLKLPADYILFGGYEGADRCIAAFGKDADVGGFPICCIRISPVSEKFADKLTHRDYLGALMNLGISRSTLGDISVKENAAYLFCLESISGYIADNLSRIRHTSVKCEILQEPPEIVTRLPDESELQVPSLRADAVIGAVYKLSRNVSSGLFASEKVFVNSRSLQKESATLKENDVVSVRGYGKFIFSKTVRQTKKGRLLIAVRIFR